jgi:membrane-associated phospholipid phosphatase
MGERPGLRHAFASTFWRSTEFIMALVMLLGIGAVMHSLNGRTGTHLLLNGYHNLIFDIAMPYITWLGDFLFLSIIAILFLIKRRWAWWIQLTMAGALTGILTQTLKMGVFPTFDRPSVVLMAEQLHLIEGVDLYRKYSFPSGHSAIAFALAITLLYISKERRFALPLLILALLAAYSRVYLSQHFLEDIVAGAWIGSLVAFAVEIGRILYFEKSQLA